MPENSPGRSHIASSPSHIDSDDRQRNEIPNNKFSFWGVCFFFAFFSSSNYCRLTALNRQLAFGGGVAAGEDQVRDQQHSWNSFPPAKSESRPPPAKTEYTKTPSSGPGPTSTKGPPVQERLGTKPPSAKTSCAPTQHGAQDVFAEGGQRSPTFRLSRRPIPWASRLAPNAVVTEVSYFENGDQDRYPTQKVLEVWNACVVYWPRREEVDGGRGGSSDALVASGLDYRNPEGEPRWELHENIYFFGGGELRTASLREGELLQLARQRAETAQTSVRWKDWLAFYSAGGGARSRKLAPFSPGPENRGKVLNTWSGVPNFDATRRESKFGPAGGPRVWVGDPEKAFVDAPRYHPDPQPEDSDSHSEEDSFYHTWADRRPTFFVSAAHFGHFYHTWADLIIPVFFTARALNYSMSEEDLNNSRGARGGAARGVNLYVLAHWGNPIVYGYWKGVMRGFRKLAQELGVYLYMNITETPPGSLPALPFAGRWCTSSIPGGATTGGATTGAPAFPAAQTDGKKPAPFVFGFLYSARPAYDRLGMARARAKFRPGIADTYQAANGILWSNGVREAARRWRASATTVSSSSIVPSRWQLLRPLLAKARVHAEWSSETSLNDDSVNDGLDHALFLLRPHDQRHLGNVEEVVRAYGRLNSFPAGWRVHFVDLQVLEFPDEQRALVSLASALIGVHGAGFVHQWWLPPGGRIVQ